jgi:hypothetical protein
MEERVQGVAAVKQLPKELIDWIESDDCGCEHDWDSFSSCCGKDLGIIEKAQVVCRDEGHNRPLFKDLSPDQQELLFITIREKYDQDYRPRNIRGKKQTRS